MPLPTLTLPAGFPMWLASSYAAEPETVFARAEMVTGHARARRIYTGASRRETCTLRLTQEQLPIFHDWHEDDLQAGLLPFAARVAELGPGAQWFDALLLDYGSKGQANGYTLIEAHLLLRGDAEYSGPEE